MRYIFAALTMVTMLAGSANAQMSNGDQKTPLQLKYEREEQERAQNEKDYNRTMKRLKAQDATKTNSDPWKTVRPSGEASAKR
jgi:hypothetical protein